MVRDRTGNEAGNTDSGRPDRRRFFGHMAGAAGAALALAATTGSAAAAAPEDASARNVSTIQALYAALGRGDIPAVLAPMHAEIDWEPGYIQNGDIPWLKPARGLDGPKAFFTTLQGFDIHKLDTLAVLSSADGEWVVVLASLDLTWKATGRRIVEPCEPAVWRFDAEGKIVSLRHASDTRQHAQALQPQPAFARADRPPDAADLHPGSGGV